MHVPVHDPIGMNAVPFRVERLPRLSREQALAESVIARWLGAVPSTAARLAKLLRVDASSITARVVTPSADFDPYAATCIVKVGDAEVIARGSSAGVVALANRILGGPAELAAPRPLNVVEQSIWCLVVATALEDLGVSGIAWPASSGNRTKTATGSSTTTRIGGGSGSGTLGGAGCVELNVHVAEISFAIQLHVPESLPVRVPPRRTVPTWAERVTFDVPVVLARCALGQADVGRLGLRSLVTVDPVGGVRVARVGKPVIGGAELEIFGGAVRIRPGAAALAAGGTTDVVAEVVSGYVPRAMSLPDDAHVELTVGLGTTRMSLRQLVELSVGQVVQLGRPLGGPFDLRAAGKLVGKGELVDVDGELAVRIVSLGDQE